MYNLINVYQVSIINNEISLPDASVQGADHSGSFIAHMHTSSPFHFITTVRNFENVLKHYHKTIFIFIILRFTHQLVLIYTTYEHFLANVRRTAHNPN